MNKIQLRDYIHAVVAARPANGLESKWEEVAAIDRELGLTLKRCKEANEAFVAACRLRLEKK
jgi:hypothetical protein